MYIRPIVEYCSCVWLRHHVKNIDLMEHLQRHFTRSVPSLIYLSYVNRLKNLDLQLLELHCVASDCIFAYKTLHHIIDNSFISLLTFHSAVTNCHMPRNHDYAFYVSQPHLEVRKFSFAVHIVQYWNTMSNTIVNAISVSQFSALLHATNLLHFRKGRN